MLATLPSSQLFLVNPGVTTAQALSEASHLLACASASAHEAAERHSGAERFAELAVVHLVEMAKALVDTALENQHHAERAMP
ncbi:DUF6124 family protein [Pseudomonas sp. NPDC007930]|uniref:DUF6124 family protein n=1 Tax=Pseudomonas sp. NPDC007930 TaxID=3364417 RepID=UPI0036E45AFD